MSDLNKDWNAQCTCGHRWHAVTPTENCPSCNPSPTITKEQAFEIILSFYWFMEAFKNKTGHNPSVVEWHEAEGRTLLEKLNDNVKLSKAAKH